MESGRPGVDGARARRLVGVEYNHAVERAPILLHSIKESTVRTFPQQHRDATHTTVQVSNT
jgi:hypothetical protein